ncbi:MAG: 8-amino-7-oxononanoate synthase [Alphaproteobacteria bacterium]
MPSLAEYCRTELAALEAAHRRRSLTESMRDGVSVTQGVQRYISFACNDYLGLSQHPAVIAAAQEALAAYGAGAGASRLVTGDHPLYAPLEAKLAAMKGQEAALVFGSGYLANIGTIPALVGKGDLILADKLVHACLLDGAQLSGATLKRFRHNDASHAQALLQEHRAGYERTLILVDHVYSMDGDVAPLAELSALAKSHDAWLMVDDAHGFGVLRNRDTSGVDLWMGTLSKSVGAYGGYVAGAREIIDCLTSAARSLVFSTGLPPANCAAALAALGIIEAEPQRGERALALARRFTDALGLPPAQSAIVPLILGEERAALAASDALRAQGILAVAIRPPTVPPGTARLRLAFSAAHEDAHVERLIRALKTERLAA